ncbi:YafY family protein [Mesoflavibacter zeaxanthinifaciens]|uniref:helix-turn-helix transcriptional regulator n=1 Tax=Mesoflavibacter zeaxanthinifaciens TaxID=393060 RepID=UPI0026EED753|nr:WYL domain-containing protein [Mesoflavibacter zeaxanthinifaciens]
MAGQAKFQKMLEVLLMLDCKYGRTISELSERFDMSTRTVYRYFDTFNQAGFIIENNNGYFKIDKQNSTAQDISQLLHFSEEEAFILSKAIHTIDEDSELKEKLVKKLYSLYDFERVIYAITKKEEAEHIYNLMQAIKHQKQVVLKEYKSGYSKNIRDRIVEPIDFTANYNGVWCYDTEDNTNKIFKASRVKKIQLLDTNWQHKRKHKVGMVDIFRVHSFEPIAIELQLSLVAYNLILEEFPLSEKYIKKIADNNYLLTTEVGDFFGVGRFVLGLPGEIEVKYPEIFKEYIDKKSKK